MPKITPPKVTPPRNRFDTEPLGYTPKSNFVNPVVAAAQAVVTATTQWSALLDERLGIKTKYGDVPGTAILAGGQTALYNLVKKATGTNYFTGPAGDAFSAGIRNLPGNIGGAATRVAPWLGTAGKILPFVGAGVSAVQTGIWASPYINKRGTNTFGTSDWNDIMSRGGWFRAGR